jgi:hypothetical protein
MIKQNLSGNGQPRNKTLDVEVNLLAEWAAQKHKRQEHATRTLTYLAAVVLLAVLTLPVLVKTSAAAATRASAAQKMSTDASKKRVDAEQQLAKLAPAMDAQNVKKTLQANCDRFFGETALLLNAAGQSMVFSSLKSDVLGGKMTMRCVADAASSEIAQDYISAAGGGDQVKSSLLSSIRRNASIGPAGVSFEYIKIVELAQ